MILIVVRINNLKVLHFVSVLDDIIHIKTTLHAQVKSMDELIAITVYGV
jgi:hypothetical protein